jgi:hypothetical protein
MPDQKRNNATDVVLPENGTPFSQKAFAIMYSVIGSAPMGWSSVRVSIREVEERK